MPDILGEQDGMSGRPVFPTSAFFARSDSVRSSFTELS